MIKNNEQPTQNEFLYLAIFCGTTFNFYVNESGQLKVTSISKQGEEQQALLIKGIPKEMQTDLFCIEKKQKLKSLLEQCYFVKRGYDVDVNARIYGGWDQNIHEDRTREWCQYTGIEFSEEDAKYIARKCYHVDKRHNPVTFSMKDQGWHFNMLDEDNKENNKDANPKDTRIVHAVEKLNRAIDLKLGKIKTKKHHKNKNEDCQKSFEKRALKNLGRGLHPIQDTFAHNKKFVATYIKFPASIIIKNIGTVKGHIADPKADDPKHINKEKHSPESLDENDKDDKGKWYSQRFTNTKLLTLFYLKCYKENRKITRLELSTYVREALSIARYKNHIKKGSTYEEEVERFQRFKENLQNFGLFNLKSINASLSELMEKTRSKECKLFKT